MVDSSWSSWEANYGRLQVFKSQLGTKVIETKFVVVDLAEFERLWHGQNPRVEVDFDSLEVVR